LADGFKLIVTCICVAREQLGKHVPAKKNSWPTTGKGLSMARLEVSSTIVAVFSMWFMRSLYKKQ
jgi:hypothetical protein